jgi:hypothetical protein
MYRGLQQKAFDVLEQVLRYQQGQVRPLPQTSLMPCNADSSCTRAFLHRAPATVILIHHTVADVRLQLFQRSKLAATGIPGIARVCQSRRES